MKTILATILVLLSISSIAAPAQNSSTTQQDVTSNNIVDENRPPRTHINPYTGPQERPGDPMQGLNNLNAGRAQ